MYLGLGVDASQIHTRYPTDATQELDQILKNCVYGAFTLYGKTFQSISTSLKRIFNQDLSHHIFSWFPRRIQFVLCRFRSTLLAASLLLSLPLPTKMFQFGRFPLLTEHPKIGSPIRPSWVLRMHAPRPGISLLAATFFSTSSQAIPQIV